MPVYASKPIKLKEITVAKFTINRTENISLNEINIKATDVYTINVQPQLEREGKHSNRLKLIKDRKGLDTVQIFTDKDYSFSEMKNTAHINHSTSKENVDKLICFAVVCKDEINELIRLSLDNTSGKDNEELNKYQKNCSNNAKIIFEMNNSTKLEDFADKVWSKRREKEEEEKKNKKNVNKKNSV